MITLPRPYLSYSAKSLWRSSKQQFRDRYYLNKVSAQTPEQKFGHDIAKQLETEITDPILKGFVDSGKLRLYPFREHRIQVTIHDVPLLGVLDGFDPDMQTFCDQKTGHTRWTDARVDALAQLPFYANLVKAQHGFEVNEAYLDYMETRFKKSTTVFDGVELEGTSDELELTGFFQTFPRHISIMDMYSELEDTIQSAHEISADYLSFKKNQ